MLEGPERLCAALVIICSLLVCRWNIAPAAAGLVDLGILIARGSFNGAPERWIVHSHIRRRLSCGARKGLCKVIGFGIDGTHVLFLMLSLTVLSCIIGCACAVLALWKSDLRPSLSRGRPRPQHCRTALWSVRVAVASAATLVAIRVVALGHRRNVPCERGLAVISTRNPSQLLLENIKNLSKFYPDFDVVVVDSHSERTEVFTAIQAKYSYVHVALANNTNWELGAWVYAMRHFNSYPVYMFIQDTLVPRTRVAAIDCCLDRFLEGSTVSFRVIMPWARSGGKGGMERLSAVYLNTSLAFIANKNESDSIALAAHSSFVARKRTARHILRLEGPYVDKGLVKSKIDCWLSEATIGLMIEKHSVAPHPMNSAFNKYNGRRDY